MNFNASPFQTIADHAWRRWGIHPHAIARQFLLVGALTYALALFLAWSAGRPMVALPFLTPTPVWLWPILLVHGFYIWKTRNGVFDMPLKTYALPLLLIMLMVQVSDMSYLLMGRLLGYGPYNDMMIPLSYVFVYAVMSLNLFEHPLSLPQEGGAVMAPKTSSYAPWTGILIMFTSVCSLVAWLVREPSMEAVLMLVACVLTWIGTGMKSTSVPPGGKPVTSGVGAWLRNLVGQQPMPEAARCV